jgi:hypothetical protein
LAPELVVTVSNVLQLIQNEARHVELSIQKASLEDVVDTAIDNDVRVHDLDPSAANLAFGGRPRKVVGDRGESIVHQKTECNGQPKQNPEFCPNWHIHVLEEAQDIKGEEDAKKATKPNIELVRKVKPLPTFSESLAEVGNGIPNVTTKNSAQQDERGDLERIWVLME